MISLEGVEVDTKRSFHEAYSSSPEPPIPVWITYHWIVFRAKSQTARITVSDWDPAQNRRRHSARNKRSTSWNSNRTTSDGRYHDTGMGLHRLAQNAVNDFRWHCNKLQLEIAHFQSQSPHRLESVKSARLGMVSIQLPLMSFPKNRLVEILREPIT